jgi:lambda family phage portal protein
MPLRPDQTRGIPFFSPVLTYFKDLADYLEAELVTARIAACFSIFVKKEQAYEAALGNTDSTNAKAQRIQEFEPGLIEYLNPGESIESFSPQRPGGSFEPFVNRILRSISTALGLPYELVAKDFSQTNYSSARAALIEAMKYFRTRQAWLERKLCQPTWELVIEEAYLKGKINATNFYKDPASYTRAIWISPGSQWIDPLKEVKASKEAMDGNITSLADVCASQGKDWEEVMEQKAREARKKKELEDKYGVTIGANDSVVDPAEIEPEEDPDETDEKERQEAAGEK